MNCRDWEERIALYTGGDLTADEAAEVERHLAGCPACQVFASGMRESVALLRDAHGEEIGSAAYAAVRLRVLGEIERRPARWWMFGLAAALAAAALLALVWLRPVKRVEIARRPPTSVPAVSPVRAAVASPPIVRVARARRHRKSIPAAMPVMRAAAPEQKPLLVKMVTDDPGVVIYWIADTRGEQPK